MDKLGIKAVFDGTSGIVSDAFIQGLGPLAEGSLAFREGAPTEKLPGGKFFMENYAAQKYDNPPEAYGAFSFAAMDLILDSIEKVGPDRKKVIEELANVKERDSIVGDRKSTRLNSSHTVISYAVFCLKKKKKNNTAVL